jgi:hypothetical protein
MTMWFCDYQHWWNLVNVVNMWKRELVYVAWLLLVYLKNIVDVMIQGCGIWLRVIYWTLKNEYDVIWLYVYYVEYNLTLIGCLVNRLPICTNG